MYLITLYFDEKTNQKIRNLMNCVAESSGNTDMIDKNIPPHITLTIFESREQENILVECLDSVFCKMTSIDINWISVAAFLPHVLYLMPVLNERLHELAKKISNAVTKCTDTKIQDCYRPFGWLPHTTVGRRLSEEEMQKAFAAMQKFFVPFDGKGVRIGLSTGSLKQEIAYWDLL